MNKKIFNPNRGKNRRKKNTEQWHKQMADLNPKTSVNALF